jgi:4-azaleucine resistance transporter AzlC
LASPRTELYAGLRAVTPALIGTFPYGVIAGLAATAAGMDASMAMAMSFIVFAGAAQIAASQLIGASAPIVVIVFTVFVINLRFMMYSAYLAPYLKHLPLRWRALIGFVVTDSGFAVSLTRFNRREEPNAHWFFLGTGLGLWVNWQIGAVLGIVAGARLPASWALDFIVPLTFLAMLAPLVRERPAIAAALAAGVTAVLASRLPYNLAVIVAAATGIATGMLAETWTRRSSG